jgi:hypothetical protein
MIQMSGILNGKGNAAFLSGVFFLASGRKRTEYLVEGIKFPSDIKVQAVDFVEIYDFIGKKGRNLSFALKSIFFCV